MWCGKCFCFRFFVAFLDNNFHRLSVQQIYDIPKHFGIEEGADYRVFLLDNHRPLHLKNVYSRNQIVVFDDTIEPTEFDVDNQYDDIPSEASNVESMSESESDNNLDSDEDTADEEFAEEGDEEEGEGRLNRYGEDEEFDADGNAGEEDDEAEEVAEGEEGDDEADEEEADNGEDIDGEDAEANDITMDLNGGDDDVIEASDNEDSQTHRRNRPQNRRVSTGSRHDMDTTMIAGYDDEEEEQGDGADHVLMDQSGLTENLHEGDEDEEMITRNPARRREEMDNDDDDEDDFRLLKRSRKSDLKTATDLRKEKRHKILQYYRKSVTYSWPTSIGLLPFVRKQFSSHGHVPLDVMWQAILGLTDHYQRGHLSEAEYEGLCHSLKIELGEHLISASDRVRYTAIDYDTNEGGVSGQQPATTVVNANTGEAATATGGGPAAVIVQVGGAQTGNIEETAEYRFFLHRHWSLFEAMTHSSYVASKFSIWNSTGQDRLRELLAEMGVPNVMCQQAYPFMRPEVREQFHLQMRNPPLLMKYNLTDPGVTYRSFCRFTGYKNRMSASDVVHAATALLELHHGDSQSILQMTNNLMSAATTSTNELKKISAHDAFHDAYNLLGMKNDTLLKKGIAEALGIQRAIVRKASAMLDGQDNIHRHHRLYYAYIKNNFSAHSAGAPGSSSALNKVDSEMELIFGRPMVLARLGQFIMEVKRNLPKKDRGWTGSNLLPLILLSERQDSSYLVMGISPFACPSGTNNITDEQQEKLAPLINFRQFFKLAAKDMYVKFRSNCKLSLNLLDLSVV